MLSQHSPTSGSDYESAWRTVNAGSNPAGVTTLIQAFRGVHATEELPRHLQKVSDSECKR